MSIDMKKNISIIITLVLLVIMAVLIFAFSAQTSEDSSSLSITVTRFLLGIFHPGFKDLDPAQQAQLIAAAHGLVRKLAHFTEYALLGAVLSMHLRLVLKMKVGHICLSAFILGACYSVLDEWHQSFVSGRAMQIKDMQIDSCGVAFGIAVVALIILLARRIKTRHEN